MRIPRIPSLKSLKAKGDEEPKTVQPCQAVQKEEEAAKCNNNNNLEEEEEDIPETNDSIIAAMENHNDDDDVSSSCSSIAASISSIVSSVLTAVYDGNNDIWCGGVGNLIQNNDNGNEGKDCEECHKPILWNKTRMVLETKDTKMYFHVPCFDYTQAAIKSQLRSGKYDRPQQPLDEIMMMTTTPALAPTPTLTTPMTNQDCKRSGTFSKKLHQKFHLIKTCRAWNEKIHKIHPNKKNNNDNKAANILNHQPSLSHSTVNSIKQTENHIIAKEKGQMQSKENENENEQEKEKEEEKEKENVPEVMTTNSLCGPPFGNGMLGCIPSEKGKVLEMTNYNNNNSGFSRFASGIMFGLGPFEKGNVPEATNNNSGSGTFANNPSALPVIELSNGVMLVNATTQDKKNKPK